MGVPAAAADDMPPAKPARLPNSDEIALVPLLVAEVVAVARDRLRPTAAEGMPAAPAAGPISQKRAYLDCYYSRPMKKFHT